MSDKLVNHNVSVDCVVFGYDNYNEQMKVLLIKRKPLPEVEKRLIALPGDLVYDDESLDEAATRVLNELTGLEGIYLKQLKAFGGLNRISRKEDIAWVKAFREYPNERVITIAYYALVKMENFSPEASYFASEAIWMDLKNLPSLAFDHKEILDAAVETLRESISHRPVGLNLLPEKFTLTQLQKLHELILNKELDKRNFRKSIKKWDHLIALDEKQVGVIHKPAQLFSFATHSNE